MSEFEARIRSLILRIILVTIIFDVISNIGLTIYYIVTDDLGSEISVYLSERIIMPTAINVLALIAAKRFNDSKKETAKSKYWACAMAFATVVGSLAVFQCYFPCLWTGPAIAMIFCSIFHDFKLIRVMFIYSMGIIALAYVLVVGDYPENMSFYMQCAIVSAIITVIAFLLANAMEEYARNVAKLNRENLEKEIELKRRLDFDPLTEVHSRGYMDLRGEEMLKNADRFNPVTVAIIDIDDFKQINDKYGHENGDKVLRTLGLLLNSLIDERHTIVGRYGGEEFLFIFEGGNINEHEALLDALRESFSLINYAFMGPTNNSCSFSGGITVTYERQHLDEVFKVADEALYIAKGKGKNNIVRK